MTDNEQYASFDTLPAVSIIVIGYNEAKNLDKTFQAINNINYPKDKIEVIYVDSGSDDGSLSIGKKYTNKCFIEDRYPSSGRNRNRGLIEALHEIVHFIDGDMEIDKDYLRKAVPIFREKDVQAVTGIHIEVGKGPLNKINRLADRGLSRTEGYTQFTSTGATYLKSALYSIDGYDERIKRGQESEMGNRFIKAGFKIWCTEIPMGYHTDGFTNVLSYLKRSSLLGKSMFQLSMLNDGGDFVFNAKKRVKKQCIRTAILATMIPSVVILRIFPLFMVAYALHIVYSTRSVFRKGNPLSIVVLKVLLKPFMNVWFEYGLYKEAVSYFLRVGDNGFYALHKEKLK